MSLPKRFLMNAAISLIAEKKNLEMEYSQHKDLEELGILFYTQGKLSRPKKLTLKEVFPMETILTREVGRYFQENEDAQNAVTAASPYRTRFGKNHDIFIRVDVEKDFEYYDHVLSNLKRDHKKKGFPYFIYLSSPLSPLSHPTCRYLLEKHKDIVLLFNLHEVQVVQLACSCAHLILSHDSLSWMIGVLAFHAVSVHVPGYEGWMKGMEEVFRTNNRWIEVDVKKPFPMDVVIPVGPHDREMLHQQLPFTQRNIVGLRHIYLVSSDPDLPIDDLHENVTVIPETAFPFTKADVAAVIQTHRDGWYLQQLLKLYAWKAIPGLSSRYLVIDADTFFLKPTVFVNEENKSLYAVGHEYHPPYFDHMKCLHPDLEKAVIFSGITHHMLFETRIVLELMDMVRETHPGMSFWKAFLHHVEEWAKSWSGASEYEIYFHFALRRYPESTILRPLYWENVSNLDNIQINKVYFQNYNDFVSCHWYARG